jgi:hypothetical protein
VEETQVTQVESDKMDEMCDSVSSLSLTSPPGSGTGSNMVSPDKTMFGHMYLYTRHTDSSS